MTPTMMSVAEFSDLLGDLDRAPDPERAIRALGDTRARRALRDMAMPAAVSEVRRAVSALAARCGVQIDPIVPGDPLVDQIANLCPNRFAVEIIAAMPVTELPGLEQFQFEISKANARLQALRDLVLRRLPEPA